MAILKLTRHDKNKEIDFELKFLTSLTIKERFNMMFKKTEEIISILKKNGHRKATKIIKRS